MVAVSLTVDLPIDTVYDYFLDFRNENEWNSVAHDVTMLTDQPIGPGSRFGGHYDRMGPMEYEIITYERPHRAEVHGNARLFRWASTFTFTEQAEGTRVDCTMDPQPKGILRVAKPLMSGMVEKQMNIGLASLKATLEAKSTGHEAAG